MKFLFVLTTIAAVTVSGCMTAPVQQSNPSSALDLYSLEHQVTLISEVNFPKRIAKGFSEFKQDPKSYYGAFAYSIDSKGAAFGSITGANTLQLARVEALIRCTKLLRGGPPCKIVAIMTPKGYVDKHKMTLSRNITEDLPSLRSGGKYTAVATSDAAFIDRVEGYGTQKSADSEALRLCNVRAKTRSQRHHKAYPCYLIPKQ